MADTSTQSIAVLGAGVVGLSTAVNIQSLYTRATVTIIADKFNTETTSDGAAGLFRPTLTKTAGDEYMIRKWSEDSFRWFNSIWLTDEAPRAGIHRIGGYVFSQTPCDKQVPLHCYNKRPLTREELEVLPGNPRYGYFTDSLMIECRRYLPWLMEKFYKNGGKTRVEKIESLSQIAGQYDVYVNCLGLSSREVFKDKEMFAVRGHLIRVHAPWVKNTYLYLADSDTYIYPGQDNVVLGGTRQKGEETFDYKKEYFDDVFTRCCKILPGLKHAPVITKWVGLRPHRTSVRMETEVIEVGKHVLWVVHNTGHGGDGVALSWGSAVAAASLVDQILHKKSLASSPETLSKL